MDQKRSEIVVLLRAGKSQVEIAKLLGVSRQMVFNAKKRIAETGEAKGHPSTGRPRTVRTKALEKAVKGKIARNPRRSIKQLAKEHKVSRQTIDNIVKDSGLMSRVIPERQLVTTATKTKRLDRCKLILNYLKHPTCKNTVFLFTDEKLFCTDRVPNRRNDRYLAKEKNPGVVNYKTKHPAKVMVFGLIASDGQAMKPHFVKQGVKLNTEEYIAILRDKVKPWVTKTYGRDVKVVLQQDEAPCHTSKLTQAWLDEHFSARSGNLDFWAKYF